MQPIYLGGGFELICVGGYGNVYYRTICSRQGESLAAFLLIVDSGGGGLKFQFMKAKNKVLRSY